MCSDAYIKVMARFDGSCVESSLQEIHWKTSSRSLRIDYIHGSLKPFKLIELAEFMNYLIIFVHGILNASEVLDSILSVECLIHTYYVV